MLTVIRSGRVKTKAYIRAKPAKEKRGKCRGVLHNDCTNPLSYQRGGHENAFYTLYQNIWTLAQRGT